MGPTEQSPSCPGCGYDQSGEVATWTDRCPVNGTCPECGTGFAWADLFDPGRKDLRWLVEHAPTHTRMWARTVPMLWHVARPAAFWKDVGVHTRVRIGALVLWCVGVLAGLHVVTTAGIWYREYRWILTLRANPRITVSLGNEHELRALLDAFGHPLCAFNAGPGWTNPAGGWGIGSITMTEFHLPAWLSASLGFTLTWVLVFAVLPSTRRRAKIRPVHVARAVVIAAFVGLIGIELVRLEALISDLRLGWLAAAFSGWAVVGLLVAVMAWTVRWWWCASRTGLELQPAGLVPLLAFVAASLGGTVCALLCDMPGVSAALSRWL